MVPLELTARLVGRSATPRLAQMLSWKYSHCSAQLVSEDFTLNHARALSRGLVQTLSAKVAQLATETEAHWHYALPDFKEPVTHLAISRDGVMVPLRQGGWRESMCGTISFYDRHGERLHTLYRGGAPEYGKKAFNEMMDKEIAAVKAQYPGLVCIGLADGAADNWTYLLPLTQVQILDFYHASQYLGAVAEALPLFAAERQAWLQTWCHRLKNEQHGVERVLSELASQQGRCSTSQRADKTHPLQKALTYFAHNQGRMRYAYYLQKGYPIGSGVTEAACKVLVKQRLACSGMRWHTPGVARMLHLRGVVCTHGRWQQLWRKIDHRQATNFTSD